GGVHGEAICRQVSVIAIQYNHEPVRVLHHRVATGEAAGDWLRVVEACAHVERLGIEEEVDFRSLTHRLALGGIELDEARDGGSGGPAGLVEAPNEGYRTLHRDRTRGRRAPMGELLRS